MGKLRVISKHEDDRVHWNEQDALAGDAEANAAIREADKHTSELAFESGRTPGSSNSQSRQVPLPFTSLVGREHEVQEACRMLRNPKVRLMTVTGTGGIGKTRLALQVALDMQHEFADDYCFVPLAQITTPQQAVLTIAQTLGLRETRKRLLFEHLKTFLSEKHLLLVLDNFERVLSAALLLPELLLACPQLKILVTSRAVLRVQGEYEFLVPPLPVPDLHHLPTLEALMQYGAVKLFMQRAQALQRDFRVTEENAGVIAAICTRLDGLPLAIELAAAHSKLLPPGVMLSRLEKPLEVLTRGGPDVPVRQQTMRNTITWSYDLLSTEEQRLFRQLAVFVGGCTLEAAEAVCTVPGDVTSPVMDVVASLLDNSLLQQVKQESDERRLMMLETIREYGLERLAASGELESARDAHANYYLALAEKAEPTLLDMHQRIWLERLEWERDNLWVALHWLVECNEREAALRLTGAIGWFWFLRGYLSEGRSLLERALAASKQGDTSVSRQVRAKALYAAGWLAFWQFDFERATVLLEESLELSRKLGAKQGMAAALNTLGIIENNHRGNRTAGDALLEESLRCYREAGDRIGIANVLMTLGIQAHYRGEFARAQELCGESLTLFRESGDSWNIALDLHVLGWTSYYQGEFATARRLSEESVALFRKLGNPGFTAQALTILAYEVAALGDETTASSVLEEALVLGKKGESKEAIARALCGLGHLALRQGNMTHAHVLYEEVLTTLMEHWKAEKLTARIKWILASCLEGLGEIALSQGQVTWTVRLFAVAETSRVIGEYRNPIGIEQLFYDRALATAHAQLGEVAFAAIWAEGKDMTPEQTLAWLVNTGISHVADVLTDSSPSTSTVPASAPHLGLTNRELEVLSLVVKGLTNAKIAEQLVIRPVTVNSYLRAIYSKLRVSSRLEAMRYAIDHNLLKH